MSTTVQDLLDLRNRTLDDYFDGLIDREANAKDLSAIAVELDRLLSPGGHGRLADRAGRVVTEILTDSQARAAAVPPARAARTDFWQRRRVERLRREDPQAAESERLAESAIAAADADETRMARPILAGLRNRTAARSAKRRVQAIAARPRPDPDPANLPAEPDVTWTDADRLIWEEFNAGVPCQGCGRPFLGDETSRRDDEPWPAYRERMAPIEAAFTSRHPDHGTRWTVGGGPAHCRRCCAPHPLSPGQLERLSQILNPPPAPVARAEPVRRCGTCHQLIEGNHVCQLADLPKALRATVEAVLERERRERDVDT